MSVNGGEFYTAVEVAEIEAIIRNAVRKSSTWAIPSTKQIDQGDYGFRLETGALLEVEADFRRAITRFPESIDLHAHLAINLGRQGKPKEGADHMEAQARRHPGDPDWQVAYVGSLLCHPTLKARFWEEAGNAYRMDLSADQKGTLNQFCAAAEAPPRVVDKRPKVVQVLDRELARGIQSLFGLDRE